MFGFKHIGKEDQSFFFFCSQLLPEERERERLKFLNKKNEVILEGFNSQKWRGKGEKIK
jgi:hypothetical protein